jgi:hypothetical protein
VDMWICGFVLYWDNDNDYDNNNNNDEDEDERSRILYSILSILYDYSKVIQFWRTWMKSLNNYTRPFIEELGIIHFIRIIE